MSKVIQSLQLFVEAVMRVMESGRRASELDLLHEVVLPIIDIVHVSFIFPSVASLLSEINCLFRMLIFDRSRKMEDCVESFCLRE